MTGKAQRVGRKRQSMSGKVKRTRNETSEEWEAAGVKAAKSPGVHCSSTPAPRNRDGNGGYDGGRRGKGGRGDERESGSPK